jgi:transcriptional regulator with XRE-family HTH domain
MPRKPPIVFPLEQQILTQLGERLKLARLRRQLSSTTVAQRAGISRTSLYKAEQGDAGVSLATALRVMAALGLEGDFHALAADDKVGRKLQDLALVPAVPRKRRGQPAVSAVDTEPSEEDGL